MPILPKWKLKQRLPPIIIRHIPHQPKPVLLQVTPRITIIDDGPRLQRELVRAVVRRLEEDELVLVRVVEWARCVGAHAEVEGLDAGGGGVGAGVCGGQELGAAEAGLDVVGGGGEDGGVVDGYFDCFVGGSVELGVGLGLSSQGGVGGLTNDGGDTLGNFAISLHFRPASTVSIKIIH